MRMNVTGRDGYIVAKALAYAILTIESLPEERQEYSDCLDMRALLEAGLAGNNAALDHVLSSARGHIDPVLWAAPPVGW